MTNPNAFEDVEVFYEATPNPDTMKFNVTRPIAESTVFFDEPLKTKNSPLAQKLFNFPWMKAVLIGPQFVAITKQEWVDWSVLADPLGDLITDHLKNGEGILLNISSENENSDFASTEILPSDSETIRKIKKLIDEEIRPAVAMDGGDIVYVKYDENILYLSMQGACSGCPSSMMTLKDGIETRLKEVIPELVEVVSV